MLSVRRLFLAAGLLVLLPTAGTAELPIIDYSVEFTVQNEIQAHLVATVPGNVGAVQFHGPSVGVEPEDWEARISDLRARDQAGSSVELVHAAPGVWRLAPTDGPVSIHYTVDLNFARVMNWPAGNEHSAAFLENTLYLVGESLFLGPADHEDWPASVRFALPPTWRATTPWRPMPGEPNAFLVDDQIQLLDNALVLGRHFVASVEVGGFHYNLAIVGNVGGKGPMLERLAGDVLRRYVEIFGDAPDGTYLQAMILTDEEDGEALSDSSGFRVSVPPTPQTAILWANTLAHELFHKWLARDGRIRPESGDPSQWFSEGLAEYYASLTLLRNGDVSFDDWRRKAEKNIGLYLYYRFSPLFEASLVDAGSDKFRNRPGVYNGGWTAAFCLDTMIRTRSQGQASLDNVLRVMDARFGRTGTAYRVEDLPDIIDAATGVDLREFFENFIFGTRTMPIDECLTDAGLSVGVKPYAGEIYFWVDETATGAPLRVRNELLGQ